MADAKQDQGASEKIPNKGDDSQKPANQQKVNIPQGTVTVGKGKNRVEIVINPPNINYLSVASDPGAAAYRPGGKGGIVSHFDQFFGDYISENKAYYKGLSKSTVAARKAHWAKTSKMDTKDPAAYEPAPGDANAKTKESKHTKAYRAKFGEEVELEEEMIDEEAGSALAKKAKSSGVSLGTLRTVYKRGVAAWRTGHRPGTTPQQWGMARVNSYITKGKGTYHGADKDLREEEDSMKSFSEFVEELELGYAEEFFNLEEDVEYEDWGEESEEVEVYAVIHEKKGPCWTGYRMEGMKKGRNGNPVPNCVKEETKHSTDMTGKVCSSCGKGKYKEMSLHDDREGKLTCSNSKCKSRVDRWKQPAVKEEAESGGRKVSLNKPFLTPGENKKRAVYVKNAKGNVVKVRFGDPNMRIRKSNPAARKSFRARHGCDVNPGPKWKAKYWSCRAW